MPTESIVFDPELNERSLDKQAQQVNETFSEATEDLQADFDDMEMDGLMPSGMGDGMGGGGMGMGGSAGVAAIASKLPGTVAAVASSAAMPVALAGGVGLGILSEMTSASARLQTSNAILGQAWNEVWQVLGGKVDQLFWRDTANSIAEELRGMADLFRDGKWLQGLNLGLTGQSPDPLGGSNLGEELGTILGGAGGLYGGAKAGATIGAMAGTPFGGPLGTAAGAAIGGGIGGLAGLLLGSRVGGGLGADIMSWWRNNVPSFSWPDLPKFSWPSLPDFSWPDLPRFNWPQLPDFSWPNPGLPDWPSAGQILGQFPSLSVSSLRNAILGGGSDGGGGGRWLPGGGIPGDGPLVNGPLLDGGGRITSTGVATVHRGELVADPDRLVSELASAVDSASGGGGTTRVDADTSEVEAKLDELNRNVRRLADSLSTEGIGSEEIARLSSSGQTNRVGDTNPRT